MTDINLLCHNVGESLKAAVIEALETKRRMGHYAVIVENGQVRRIGPQEIGELLRGDNSECPNNLSQGEKRWKPVALPRVSGDNIGGSGVRAS